MIPHKVCIRPSKHINISYFLEAWQSRRLLLSFIERDLRVRYKQTLMGIIWAVLPPFLSMFVFTLIVNMLGYAEKFGQNQEVPYSLFAFTSLLLWQFFANSISNCTSALVSQRSLLTRIFFPRVLLPLAAVGTSLVDYIIGFLLLVGLSLWYTLNGGWSWNVTSLLVGIIATVYAVLVAIAIGLWVAALNARYRDVQYIVPFALQMMIFLSPVLYPLSLAREFISPKFLFVYELNPFVGALEYFRWAWLGVGEFPHDALISSVIVTMLLMLSGVYYFRVSERVMVDVI